MTKKIIKNNKAISPVIATIIIVAVAIVMSIAVAYWMMGVTTTLTRYEKLEFISAYPVKANYMNWIGTDTTPANVPVFNITIVVKNTGTSPATVTKFFLNGVPDDYINVTSQRFLNYTAHNVSCGLIVEFYDDTQASLFNFTSTTVTIAPGETRMFKIIIAENALIGIGRAVSGASLEIVIQTAAGYQYPKTIVLP
ncbi:MAG: archaellin/type IV pilin N-terminal domain-containing protein [Nitrososphaerota archaeon]|nr:archaellin/type IV pilin N-terminal domain-containing protein [Nitrososphaerota archaeon]